MKKNIFGQYLIIKKALIRLIGLITHRTFNNQRFNIQGTSLLNEIPKDNVLFISNHQTYFYDVISMLHVFNASVNGRKDSLKNILYLLKPKLNIYFVAALETMKASLVPKILSYAGSILIKRTWREAGKEISRNIRTEDFDNILGNIDERRLPWPGGIKQGYEKVETKEIEFNEEYFKKKPIEFYNFLIEKIAELKFSFGEFLKDKEIINRSPYLIYIYAFLILFAFGIGIGFLRNNFKKSIQDESIAEKPLIAKDKNQKISEIDIIQEIKKNPSSKLNSISEKSTSIISYEFKELNTASPSLEDIRNLINGWLLNKSNYLAGKGEINLSKIVSKGLIDRTIEERQNDIKKGIYKEINSQIRKIDLESQTSSRIVVLVELNYFERTIKNSGEFVNETSLTPLKVKYILGFSNKSWKLVDFVSGL